MADLAGAPGGGAPRGPGRPGRYPRLRRRAGAPGRRRGRPGRSSRPALGRDPQRTSPRGWSRDCRPSTPWTPGARTTTPTTSFWTAPGIWPRTPTPGRSPTWWTCTASGPSGATPGWRSGSGPRPTSRSRWSAASRARSRRAPQPACAPAGIPVLEDVASGLRAFRHLFERRDARALPPLDPRNRCRRRTSAALARSTGRRGSVSENRRPGDARRLRGAGGADRRRGRPRQGSSPRPDASAIRSP